MFLLILIHGETRGKLIGRGHKLEKLRGSKKTTEWPPNSAARGIPSLDLIDPASCC